MTSSITPSLWFNGTAAEAGAFYTAALPWTVTKASGPMAVDLDVDGCHFTLINADDTYRPTPAISFILNFDPLMFDGDVSVARRALDDTWAALSDGGETLMPLAEYPFAARYGWVQDRYGVSWQVMLTRPEGDPRPFVIPQLLFSGAVHGRAREAADFYTSLFSDAGIGTLVPYPAPADGVMFGEFHVGRQWFSMMDSAAEHDFGFTPGVSLVVRCAHQSEIDRLWDALSAVPEAEQCGWLVDRFGVSWQIIPQDLDRLLARPGAVQRMLSMKKLVIAEL